jgi:cation diffusion facilitator CzcD-associated flavoprotein CzcO
MKIKNIGIIGAGISGLVTAKTLVAEGYEVTVFEKQQGLGGVWEKSRTYPELSVQNPGITYCFSDYPMPASFPEWPTAEDMRNYLESYAQHFEVIDKIRFQTEVVEVSRKANTNFGWVVTVQSKDSNSHQVKEESYEFDFVVVCNGMFNTPKLPVLAGKEEFMASGGQVLHSTELNDSAILKDKRVVVVGTGKSASDIANIAAKLSRTCTLVFRKATWKVPRFILGFIHIKKLILTRFSEAWFPYITMGRWEKILHTFGRPLVWIFWRTIESILRLQFGLDRCGMLPEAPIDKMIGKTHLEPTGFYKNIHSGKIQIAKTTVSKFTPSGVELGNGQQVEADIVIFGTGFTQTIPFLDEKYRRLLFNPEGMIYLYRHLIHPEISQMAFIGYQDSFYNPLTSEAQSWWLVDYLQGYLSLPSVLEMHQSIQSELEWLKNWSQHLVVSGSGIYSFTLRHVEQLIKDMDTNNQVVIWKEFSQIMNTLDVSIYSRVRQELKSQRSKTEFFLT